MLRALHLASFNGNIGDIANHTGFWELFRKQITRDVTVDHLEIREFYKSWSTRFFDDDFIDLVNGYDMLVIGGGNFFEAKWDYSRTGTTIDIPPEMLERIRVPVVFNGMGVDYNPDKPTPDARDKFIGYLDYLNSHPERFVVSVRNDDSEDLLDRYFEGSRFGNILQIPDGGFFTVAREYAHAEVPENRTIVAVNVAKDRIADRWGSQEQYERYCREFAVFLDQMLEENESIHCAFIPHIPSDLVAIGDIMKHTNDRHLRQRVSVSPYINGFVTPGDYQTDLYRKAALAVSMRYHSNICSIAMGTPTIGIVTLSKHMRMYENIGMQERLFNVREDGFAGGLAERVRYALANHDRLAEENRALTRRLEKESEGYYLRIRKLLEEMNRQA